MEIHGVGIRNRLGFAAGCASVSGIIAVAFVTPASAATCNLPGPNNNDRWYDGFQGTQAWGGIEGDIEFYYGMTTPEGSYLEHALSFLSMDQYSPPQTCGGQGNHCWLQVGDGTGNISGNATNGNFAYEENADVNGYHDSWYFSLGLSTDNYYSDFYTGQTNGPCPSAAGLYDAYVNTGSGPTLIGQAWLPACGSGAIPNALTEAYVGASGTCPTWAPWQTFGETSTFQSSPSTTLDLSPKGSTWGPWSSSDGASTFADLGTFQPGDFTLFQMYSQ